MFHIFFVKLHDNNFYSSKGRINSNTQARLIFSIISNIVGDKRFETCLSSSTTK